MTKIKNPDTKVLWNYFHHVAPKNDTGWEKGTFHNLSRDRQIMIARYGCPWFNPPHRKVAEKTYTKKWWDGLNAPGRNWSDAKSAAVWECILPERTKPGEAIRDSDYKAAVIDFYAEVTQDNAKDWYLCLPEHLRKTVDIELAHRPNGGDAKKDSIYEQVFQVWGDRPELPDEPKDELEGITADGLWRIEVWKEWVRMYNDLQLRTTTVELAPGLQRERKMLSNALGLPSKEGSLPSQAEGLDDTQAATIRWLQESGETPLEFLAATYRNPDAKTGERIAAAAKLMEFVHRKVPVKTEVETKDTSVSIQAIDREQLRGLSKEDLKTLEAILARTVANQAKGD